MKPLCPQCQMNEYLVDGRIRKVDETYRGKQLFARKYTCYLCQTTVWQDVRKEEIDEQR